MVPYDRNEITQEDDADVKKVLLLEFLTQDLKVPIFFKRKIDK